MRLVLCGLIAVVGSKSASAIKEPPMDVIVWKACKNTAKTMAGSGHRAHDSISVFVIDVCDQCGAIRFETEMQPWIGAINLSP